jgi:hypothetical protein
MAAAPADELTSASAPDRLAPGSANRARFLPGQRAGHYESWFQRANHPTRPLAFWIRYTVFSPEGRPHDGVAELWAIFFDGEVGAHVAVRREVPISRARFDRRAFDVRIEETELGPGALRGEGASGGHRIAWDMRYGGEASPLLLYPEVTYEAKLPRAKALVGVPLAVYHGTLEVDGRRLEVDGWVGSQNHNWGSEHTDAYAWGQVAGFDESPSSFLEIGTGRTRIAGVWTPWLTPAVLLHRGREHRANGPLALARARAEYHPFAWRFAFETGDLRAEGSMEAELRDFVGLGYQNPPGGVKHCLNTKIASCRLTLVHKRGPERGREETLTATRRAAFEILTDDPGHGVAMLA